MLFRAARRVFVAVCALGFVVLPARATTYTVNSTADTIAVDGAVTLREAIVAAVANAPAGDAPAGTPGLDTINFNIPGAGVHTIVLTSDLPLILDPIFLDGLSQPGAAPGSLLIEIHGGSNPIQLTGGSGSTVRGLVIEGFAGNGILIQQSSSNVIASNFIGTDATGTSALAGPSGVAVLGAGATASNNVIGGSSPQLGNLIVATDTAIAIVASTGSTVSNTIVAGNRLGTNAAGTAALGSLPSGILVSGTTNTMIGGTAGTTPGGACSGPCNLIDAVTGISVGGSGDALTIAGNFIGTNLAGTAAAAGSSAQAGIIFNTPFPWTGSVMIGGTTAAARNLISGLSRGWGIFISGQNPPSSIVIAGNSIGVDTAGTSALPNLQGIRIESSSAVTIGGTSAPAGNLISGNQTGVVLQDSSGIFIQSNVIGPAASGTTPPSGPQQGEGVLVTQRFGTSMNNVIGAQTSGGAGGNVIADSGIGVQIAAGTNNRILSNSMFDTFAPIALGSLPAAPSDPCDTDTGPNNLQNSPVLTNAAVTGGGVTLTGDLNSTANTTFTIEVFSSPPANTAQAKTLILSTTATTNANCDAPLNIALPSLPAGTLITATATDPSGNTSPVSNSVGVATVADLAIGNTASVPLLVGGQNITYSIFVVNQGPGTANQVVVTDTLPAGTTFVSSTPQGACSGTTTITCTIPSLNTGFAITFTIVVKTPFAGGRISDTATVSAATTDPNLANNSATATVTLAANSAIPMLSPILLLMLCAVLVSIAAYKLN